MPQIGIADKQTLDNTKTVVDTVNTKVGTNADLAGTTTVFARVRQIYEYMVNTLLVAINGRQANWGAVAGTKTNIDNTATNVNTINTNVNTINTKIGVSTDTGTTTLFGKLSNVGGIKSIQRGTVYPLLSTSTPTHVITVASVNINKSFINVINLLGDSIPTQISATLVNSTTIHLTYHGGSGSSWVRFTWELIEFN